MKLNNLIEKIVLIETSSVFISPIIIGELLHIESSEIEIGFPMRLSIGKVTETSVNITGMQFIPIPEYICEKIPILLTAIVSYTEAPTGIQSQYMDFAAKARATLSGIVIASGGDFSNLKGNLEKSKQHLRDKGFTKN